MNNPMCVRVGLISIDCLFHKLPIIIHVFACVEPYADADGYQMQTSVWPGHCDDMNLNTESWGPGGC